MKKLYKILAVGAIGFSLSAASVVYAKTVSRDGGTWSYGYSIGSAYSHYKHDYNHHGAKVVNANNGVKNFKNAAPGVWAKAAIGNIWDSATFYYNPNGYYSY